MLDACTPINKFKSDRDIRILMMKKIRFCLAALILTLCTSCDEDLECSIGERICVDNVSKTCYQGRWRSVECTNAAPICDEKYGCIPIPQTCGNETIEGTEECDGNALGGKTCHDMFSGLVGTLSCKDCKFDTSQCHAPGCENGTKRCSENGVETCNDGQWQQTRRCKENERCDSTKAACIPYIACDTPGVACNENILTICANGQLLETECQENQTCSVVTASCEPTVCRQDERKCDGNMSKICIQNGWHDAMDCAASNMLCDNTTGLCAQSCENGAASCNDDNTAIISCQNGLQNIANCGTQQRCVTKSTGPICETWVCDEGIECKGANENSTIKLLKICENNVLIKKETCRESDGVICSVTQAACVPLVCKGDDTECQTTKDASHIAKCQNNAWILTPCTQNDVCTMDVDGDGSLSCQPKVCDEGYKCIDKKSVFCWNNNVVSRTDCGQAGCDDSTGKCKS